MERNRLFIDLETSPNVGFFWQAGHEIDVGTHNIITERAIICICWKWAGDKRVQSLEWDQDQDDKEMVKKFSEIMLEADEVIGHNGDRFDIKWIRTRAIFHRIPFPPQITSIDTLKNARSLFKFNSNRLDYVAQYLGVGRKIDTGGFDTWRQIILDKNQAALKRMVKYCKNDVIILEKVWDVLNPYVPPKTNFGKYSNKCPECEKPTLSRVRRVVSATGVIRHRLRCRSCGKCSSLTESEMKIFEDYGLN